MKDGFGQYFYENGTRYTGLFQNNMKHGRGRLDEEDGTYYEGNVYYDWYSGLFYVNNKDKYGIYFDAATDKKFMHVYENGKLTSEREIMDGPEEKEITSGEKKINDILGKV